MRAFKPQDRFQRFQHRPGAENGPAGLRGPKGVDRGKAAEEPGGEPARRGEPPLRMPLCGPRTPPCGPSSPQHPLGIRRGAENGPAGLWEPKGVQTAGRGRPRNRPRLRQGQNLRSGCPWAAPGTPESHFPAPEGSKGRLDLERGWKRRPERKPGKPGRRALGRTGGRESGPAPGDLGKAKAAAGGESTSGDVRRPEGPGRGGGKTPGNQRQKG